MTGRSILRVAVGKAAIIAALSAAALGAACAPDGPAPFAVPAAAASADDRTGAGTPSFDFAPFLGAQQITLLAVRSDSTPAYTDSAFLAQVAATASEMHKALRANAAGRLQVAIDIVGVLHIPPSVCDTTTWENTPNQHAVFRAAVDASDSIVDYSTVRQVLVIYQGHAGCLTGHSGARRRLWGIQTEEGEVDASMAFVTGINGPPYSTYAIHEFTHTIGATHGEPLICRASGERVLVHHGPAAEHWSACAIAPPYLNGIDPMGLGMHHFTPHHKIRWGWIAPTEVRTIASSGAYALYPTEGPHRPGFAKALRIPVTSGYYHSLLLEYRSTSTSIVPNPVASLVQQPGVYLYADRSSASFAWADVLEPIDGWQLPDEFQVRPLPVGASVTDAAKGLTILVESVSDVGAVVRITRNVW